MVGRRPVAAFGNWTGERHMPEHPEADEAARLAMQPLHDDAERE